MLYNLNVRWKIDITKSSDDPITVLCSIRHQFKSADQYMRELESIISEIRCNVQSRDHRFLSIAHFIQGKITFIYRTHTQLICVYFSLCVKANGYMRDMALRAFTKLHFLRFKNVKW